MSFTSRLRRWNTRMSNTLTARGRAAGARRRAVRHRPALEGLEDRVLLSGVAVDDGTSRLFAFDDLTGTPTGLVSLPTSSGTLLDAVISPDKTLAYVSDFYNQRVWVVDLATNALSSGTNPISVP